MVISCGFLLSDLGIIIPKFSRNILRSDNLHHILKSMEKVSLQYTDDGSDVSNAEEIENFKAIYGDGFPN